MTTGEPQSQAETKASAKIRRSALLWCGVGLYLLLSGTISRVDAHSNAVYLTGLVLLAGIAYLAVGANALMTGRFPLWGFLEKTELAFWLGAILFQIFNKGESAPGHWLVPALKTVWLPALITAVSAAALGGLAAFHIRRRRHASADTTDVQARAERWISPRARLFLVGQAAALLAANQAAQGALPGKSTALEAAAWGYAILLLLAAVVNPPAGAEAGRRQAVISAAREHLPRISGVFTALLLALMAAIAGGTGGTMPKPAPAMLGWGGAIGLVVWSGWQPITKGSAVPRRVWLTAGGLFAAALLARVIHLSGVPLQLAGDEARFGFSGIDYIVGKADNPFSLQVFLHPGLFSFAQSWLIRLLGRTELALRLLPAVVGAATAPAIYLMGRRLFSERAGLFAGIFLAAFHFHVHFSRLGLNQVFDALAFTAVLAALYTGWTQERRPAYLLAGIGLGLSQYFYMTARALLVIVPLWLVLAGAADFRRLKRSWSHLLWMLAAALATYMPLVWIAAHRFNDYMGPVNSKVLSGISEEHTLLSISAGALDLLRRVALGLMAYTVTPGHNWYEPGVPFLRTLPALLFLIGLGLLAVRWKDSRSAMIALWLLAFGAIGGLSENTPASQRYLAVAPALALVVGYTLSELPHLGESLWPKSGRAIGMAAVGLALLIAADDARYYFLDYTPRSLHADIGGLKFYWIAKDLQHDPPGQAVYFIGAPEHYDTVAALPFLTPNVEAVSLEEGFPLTRLTAPRGKPVTFVVLFRYPESVQAIQSLYPGGELLSKESPAGGPLYWIYRYRPE